MRMIRWLVCGCFWVGCSVSAEPVSDAGAGQDEAGAEQDGGEGADAADEGADAGGGGADASGDAGGEVADGGQDAGLCSACGACERNLRVSSARHVEGPIDYADVPPAGGNHNGCWTTFGVHKTEVPDERWVHNLEHGAVVFLYHCPDGCDQERAQLEALAKGRSFALVTPYEALPTRFGVVAWEYRLLSDCFDAEAFRAFYSAHADQAPESLDSPPPSSCP